MNEPLIQTKKDEVFNIENPASLSWMGNDTVFKTYVRGNPEGDGKAPMEKIKGRDSIRPFESASTFDCFGGILNEDFVDISFDNKEMYQRFLDMAEKNEWKCLALPSEKGGHTYWRNTRGQIPKGGKDKKLAVGLIADIHNKNTYIPLRVHGSDRFPPDYDILSGEDYQEVPEELVPVATKINLWDLNEGAGRNDALSGAAKFLIHNTRFTKETIRRIMKNANDFVFSDPLPESEVNTILRDETFEDLTEIPKLITYNAAELAKMDLPPVEFIVESLIPVGLTLLASPPKYGKSWMCLDLGLSVATGEEFLGFKTNQCRVLYLALEDSFNRLDDRIEQITKGGERPEDFDLNTESENLDTHLLEQLSDYLYEYQNTKLIIIDTFIKVRGQPQRNETAYAVDSREAGIIKKFADSHGIAIVLVTHTRKSIDPNDSVVNISGTYGVAGAADNMIVLSRDKRSDTVTKMTVTGRDVSYEEYSITRSDSGKWNRESESYDDFVRDQKILEEKLQYWNGNTRKTILRLVEENGGEWKGRCKDIIEKSNEYGTPIALTSQRLGSELKVICGWLYEDGILYDEPPQGTASKLRSFKKIDKK